VNEGGDPTRGGGHGPVLPLRRTHGGGSRARDVDSFDKVLRFRVLAWSLIGAFLGFLLGVFAVARGTSSWILLVTIPVGWASAYFGPLLILRIAGQAGATLYAPSGRSTPRAKEYSLAESFVVRGMYDEAVAALQEAIDDDPADWQPYLRIARMKRDRTADAEGSAIWFKRALRESAMPSGTRLLVLKEYVELCTVGLEAPGKAVPLLARIAELEGGTPEGSWAAEALAEIKRAMSSGASSE